jgi:ATP-dependent Clp protease ATP-binding subunit ClpA
VVLLHLRQLAVLVDERHQPGGIGEGVRPEAEHRPLRPGLDLGDAQQGREGLQQGIGFGRGKKDEENEEAIKRLFTPEFRNRLDAVISFAALDEQVILRVVDKFLMQLEEQLQEKKVEPHFTTKLKVHLAKKGFDPLMGARPMQRLIQDTIRRALADELLFGRLVDGGRLTVDIDDKGEVLLDIQPPRKSDKPKTEASQV